MTWSMNYMKDDSYSFDFVGLLSLKARISRDCNLFEFE